MISEITAVYDAKAERFIELVQTPTTGVALRSFQEAVNTDGTDFAKYAEDYTLFHLGSFDHETGSVIPLNTPESLALAITLKETRSDG